MLRRSGVFGASIVRVDEFVSSIFETSAHYYQTALRHSQEGGSCYRL